VGTTQRQLSNDFRCIARGVQGFWEALRGGQLFITGGVGFFGCWLWDGLLWADDTLLPGCSAVVLTKGVRLRAVEDLSASGFPMRNVLWIGLCPGLAGWMWIAWWPPSLTSSAKVDPSSLVGDT